MFGWLLAVPRLRRVAPDQKREDSSALGSIIFAVIPRGAGTRDEPLRTSAWKASAGESKEKDYSKVTVTRKGQRKQTWVESASSSVITLFKKLYWRTILAENILLSKKHTKQQQQRWSYIQIRNLFQKNRLIFRFLNEAWRKKSDYAVCKAVLRVSDTTVNVNPGQFSPLVKAMSLMRTLVTVLPSRFILFKIIVKQSTEKHYLVQHDTSHCIIIALWVIIIIIIIIINVINTVIIIIITPP